MRQDAAQHSQVLARAGSEVMRMPPQMEEQAVPGRMVHAPANTMHMKRREPR